MNSSRTAVLVWRAEKVGGKRSVYVHVRFPPTFSNRCTCSHHHFPCIFPTRHILVCGGQSHLSLGAGSQLGLFHVHVRCWETSFLGVESRAILRECSSPRVVSERRCGLDTVCLSAPKLLRSALLTTQQRPLPQRASAVTYEGAGRLTCTWTSVVLCTTLARAQPEEPAAW